MRSPHLRRWVFLPKPSALLFAIVVGAGLSAGAQSLSVLPVNLLLQPGQGAASLTVTNNGSGATAIQIRAYEWRQKDGDDQLLSSDAIVVSPPLATIGQGASQVVRIILRHPAQGQEATYRILVDQIPPPTEPGVVHIVLRLSIPIFAEPVTRALPHLQFHFEWQSGQLYLVGVNDGLRHEAVRDIVLSTSDAKTLKPDPKTLPYILAGGFRRWHFDTQGQVPLTVDALRFTAHTDAGIVEQQARVVVKP